jgi:beta-lactamase regulating signal transducer with metallopeptidase domain
MNGSSTAFMLASLCVRLLAVLGSAALKASLIFIIVYFAALLLRDSRPGQRHLLWCGAIFSYLLILLLSLFSLPLLPFRRPVPSDPDGLARAVSTLLLSPRDAPAFVASGARAASAAQVSPGQPGWASLLALLWAGGVLAGLLQLGVGVVRLRLLLVQARRSGARPDKRLAHLCRELAAAAGIRRTVRLVCSPGCQVPFAAGTLRPLLVLPSSARAWPQQRLRAALLHELRHIRRLDPLTQTASRLVCCLFWFVPLVWFAHWFLYAEQEKACDSSAVESGVARRDYASCLLFAARRSPLPPAFAGLYSPPWSRRILEDRIRSVMAPVPGARRGWPILAFTAVVICVLALLGGAGGRVDLSDAEAYQRFVGTWVNTEYPGTLRQSQITVIRPDYVGEDRLFPDSTSAEGQWTIKVKKTWVDGKGNTCCQFYITYTKGMKFGGAALMRVDKRGQTWEINSRKASEEDTSRYLEDINPELQAYWIYYRKK